MKTIRKKLRSDRGSSMVLALFLMLVALMVSHTILAAALQAEGYHDAGRVALFA